MKNKKQGSLTKTSLLQSGRNLFSNIIGTIFTILVLLASLTAFSQPPVPTTNCGRNILELEPGAYANIGTAITGFSYSSGTIEAWVRKDDWSDPIDDALFSNGIGFNNANSFYISFHNDVGLHFRYGGQSQAGNIAAHVGDNSSTSGLADNSWHHIAATWNNDGSKTHLVTYIDGIEIATASTSTNLVLSGGVSFGIGEGISGSISDFQGGSIAEMRVWDVARTQGQIQADMGQLLVGNETNLIGYWPLNDVQGSTTAANLVQPTEVATLMDFTDIPNAWVNFPLEVKAAGNLILSGGTYDFGTIFTGASSNIITYTIINHSSSSLDLLGSPITVLSGANADQFTLDLTGTASVLAAGGSTTFTLSFDPTSVGTKNATISLMNVASCSDPYTVDLTGEGLAFLTYSGDGFTESISNDGSVTGSITITLSEDTFQDTDADNLLDVGSEVTINNVSTGFTPVLTLNSSTEAVLTLTGNATAHQNTNDVADITFEFADAAFTNTIAANIINATGPASSSLGIDFVDNPANDDCTNAQLLTVYTPGEGTTTPGTTEFAISNTELSPCTEASGLRDVWYSFNTGDADQIVFTTETGTASSVSAALYTTCGEILQLPDPFGGTFPACASYLTNPAVLSLPQMTNPLVLSLPQNTDFLVQVWSSAGDEGSFSILLESNSPPDITPVADKAVDEGTLLQFTVTATDTYIPGGERIRYYIDQKSLDLRMSMGEVSGEFNWTPTEDQDGTYVVSVSAVDFLNFFSGTFSVSTATFEVTVNEVNEAPVLSTIGNKALAAGNALDFTATATDADLPANTLAYGLDAVSLNKGMAINSVTGEFSWSPATTYFGTTSTVTLSVSDGELMDEETFTIEIEKADQTITFEAIVPKTFGDAAFDLAATGGESGNVITYLSSDETVAKVSGNTLTIVGAGTATITASQSGNDNYNAASNAAQVLTVNKAAQTIIFDALPVKTFGDAAFDLAATGGESGNVITYLSSDETVATVSGNTLTIVGAGTATITASQSGNDNYNAASNAAQVLTVNKATQTIVFDALPVKTFGDAAFDLAATGGESGNVITYLSSDETVATVSGNTLTIVGAGTATITASQSGNDNYNAASNAAQVLTVNKAAQTIIFDALPVKTFGDAAFDLAATGGESGNVITYLSSDETVATVSANTLTIVGAGTATITASQAGSANYAAAENVSQVLTVNELVVTNVESDVKESIKIQVYPNPVKNQITLFVENDITGSIGVSIRSITGQLLSHQNIFKDQYKLQTSIQVEHLRSNIYLIEVRMGDQSSVVHRIIKK